MEHQKRIFSLTIFCFSVFCFISSAKIIGRPILAYLPTYYVPFQSHNALPTYLPKVGTSLMDVPQYLLLQLWCYKIATKGLVQLNPNFIVDGDFSLANEIDSWGFQQMLDLGFCATSQYFSSFQEKCWKIARTIDWFLEFF